MADPPDRHLSRAVLIGTSKFQNLPNLPAVRNNLTDLRAALTDPLHGILAPENCRVINNPRSPTEFMRGLSQVSKEADDFLLVYYAGHGVRHDRGDSLYLTVESTDPDVLNGTAVPFEWVRELLEERQARSCLLVLDCCYSGLAVGTMSGPVDQQEIKVRGSAVIASAPRNKVSHSPTGDRHSAFTGKMIGLLRDGSPLPNEPLTVMALYRRVLTALVRDRFPEPKLNVTGMSGELLVRRFEEPQRPSAVQEPPPATVPEPGASADSPQGEDVIRPATAGMVAGLGVLWTWVGAFLCMGLSALIGIAFGEPVPGSKGDGYYVGIGFSLLPLGGLPLLRLRWLWRDRIRARGLPLLARTQWGRAIAGIGVVFFGAIAFTADPASSTTGSEMASRAAFGIAMSALVIACGYPLFRWWQALRKSRH